MLLSAGWVLLVALVCLVLGLWLLFGPDRPLREPRDPQEIDRRATPEEIVDSFARALEPAKPLNMMPAAHERACEDCRGRRLVWTRCPSRPQAWIAICRRCGKVRLDVVQGQTLAL